MVTKFAVKIVVLLIILSSGFIFPSTIKAVQCDCIAGHSCSGSCFGTCPNCVCNGGCYEDPTNTPAPRPPTRAPTRPPAATNTPAPPSCNLSCGPGCPWCGCNTCTGVCDMTCDDEDPTDVPPEPTATPSPTPTPTPTPLPWYKLKSASFHTSQTLSNAIPPQITPFDPSDSGETTLIIGGDTAGVVSAEGTIEVAPGTVSPHGWSITDYRKNQGFLSDLTGFIQYARARKNVAVITDLDQIRSDMILIYEGNLELSDIGPNAENFVLIVRGNVVIPDSPSHTFNPEKRSIAVIATGSFGINHMISEINGILIANSYDLAHGVQSSANPLKITGNLISSTAIQNIKRERIDRLMPSVYVTFDPLMYEDLLPQLSTILLSRRLLE